MQKALLVLLLAPCLLAGCRVNKAVPLARELPESPRGVELIQLDKRKTPLQQGELLALTPDTAYVLTTQGHVLHIPKTAIETAQLNIALTSNQPASLRAWAGLTNLLTLSHGLFMVFTLPLNIGITSAVGTGAGRAYQVDYPQQINWEEMNKFARFPQGLPRGVPLSQLR
ncbi:hypothetical protein [Hymenobacter sediminicola]|uniref:Uncharacterized protein n=1 Tax=Hymenobacter sediminicola TaxID=2761579 RepID=A0A7G7W9B3_9BACT|nr:hypothetical protein [Hymenobacter sediminicola]QNH62956.1 hypothetical protein H4317_03855 [Hymenobacter sediminicola]